MNKKPYLFQVTFLKKNPIVFYYVRNTASASFCQNYSYFHFCVVQGILTHFLVFFRYTYGKPVDGRVLVKFSMVGGRFKDVLVKEIPDQVTGVERRSYIK